MSRRTLAVAAIVTLATAWVAALWLWPLHQLARPAGPGPELPWWLLAIMFAVTEAVVLHVQSRSEVQSVSLSEIPLVLGLIFADPHTLAWARVVGAAVILTLYRRQRPIKLLYNVVMQAAEVSTALLVYSWLRAGAAPTSLRGLLATFAAVAALTLVSGWSLQLVTGLADGEHRLRNYLHETVVYPPTACGVAMFGLVAAYALRNDLMSSGPLLGSLVVLLIGYRAYSRLNRRHLGLERLYQFTQAVSSSPEAEEVLRSVLSEAKEMLKAGRAEIALLSDFANGTALVSLRDDEVLRRDEPDDHDTTLALHRYIVERDGEPQLMPRTTRDELVRGCLNRAGFVDAIVVPLRGSTGLLGTLTIGDRLGDVGTFTDSDMQVLRTLASQAGVALQNGRLIGQLRHEALHDHLTGLPNRSMFERVVTRQLERVHLGHSTGIAVGILDLDGFKDVNDTLGHQYGDQLLVEVGRRLGSLLVSEGHVARFGGDEFAILLTDVGDEQAVLTHVQSIATVFDAPIHLQGMQVQVRASIGIAMAPIHGTDLALLLKRADIAMYDAKNTSSGVRLFDRHLDDHSPSRLALIADLRHAVLEGQLMVAVQPKVRFDTGEVTGVEALVRWKHPEQGPIGPDVFIPLAERNGLISPLTERVLDVSLAACSQWLSHGRNISVAVNLSPRGLLDPGLVSSVVAALARHRVPPAFLTLEITEGSVMTNPDQALAVLHELRAAGIRLSVDDFGTGYSSLSYLKRLPVQEIKIDRSFITDLIHNNEDVPIVRSIVDLGANLGLDVVAEGIEDGATWQRLQELNCTLAQGYHVSHPMPVDEFLGWLSDREAQQDRDAARLDVPSARRPGDAAAETSVDAVYPS
jgi:diguanylate cyclase (GGDEF)-like protein